VAVERSGDDFVVRDFDPKIGPGAMRFRYKVPGFDPHEQSSEDLSPDGTRLVVLRADLPGYAVLDASSGRELDRIRLPAHSFPQSVRWAADGTTLYASGQDVIAGKWIVRLGAHGVEQVLWKSENVWPGYLDLSPDGSTIAFTSLEFNHDMWLIERH
jgi:WD40 repeat protein